MIEKEIPLYMRVYGDIKKKIENAVYAKGDFLPSEQELQNEFGVSRITVRRAISDLENDGLVEKINGKGTKVLRQKPYTDLFKLSGFNEDALRDGDVPASVILKFEIQEASSIVAKSLEIEKGEQVYYLERLRLLNGRVSGIHKTFISMDYDFEIKIEQWTPSTSLYEFYAENKIIVKSADEVIEAILPNEELAKQLYITQSEPIFYRQRVTFDENDKAIEYSQNYYIAKEHKYFVRMQMNQ